MSDVCMSWALSGKISLNVTLQDQAAALHAMGMMGYSELKSRLMSTTAFLVATGSLIAFSAGGSQAAYPFAVGGSAALGYQWLLQQSVDSIPSKLPRRTLVKVSTCSLQLGGCAPHVYYLICLLVSCFHKCPFSAVYRYVQSSSLCGMYGHVMSVTVPTVMCILRQAEQLHPNFCNHDQGRLLVQTFASRNVTFSRPCVLALHRHCASCLLFAASSWLL